VHDEEHARDESAPLAGELEEAVPRNEPAVAQRREQRDVAGLEDEAAVTTAVSGGAGRDWRHIAAPRLGGLRREHGLRCGRVLLERDSELGMVGGFLDGVCGGAGGVMVLEGPPGIGKTALLRAVSERAAGRGVDVLHARASQLDRGFAFGVARHLLERRLRAAAPAERESLLGGAARDALPALGLAGDDAEGDAGLRSLHGLYWLVANLASRGPLMLCVDDAHWADRSSLRWLLYSASRLAGLPLGIVMTTRAGEPGAEQDLLDALTLDDSAGRVRLRPLSAAAVGVLIGASLSGAVASAFAAACHRSTGGNPLLLHELLRELAEKGVAPTVAGAEQLEGFGVEAVARNVRGRLHGLGSEAATVASAVAVIGDGATVMEVAALCGCDEAAVGSAAAELAAIDLLLSDVRLTFVHPLVRTAVYEDMAPVRRMALHRRAAALRDGAGDPEQVAVHLLHVDPRADAHTVDVLRAAAAGAAGRGAPDAAVTFLRRALAEPPDAGAPRAAVLVELGEAEALARMDGFEQHLRGAIAELDDAEWAAEVALSLVRALSSLGHWERAFDVAEEAFATLDPSSALGVLLEAELLASAHAYGPLRPRVAVRVNGYLQRLERGEHVDAVVLGALSPWLLREHPPAERAVQAAEAALADARLIAPLVSTPITPSAGWALLGAGRLARAGEVFDAAIAEATRRGELLTLGWASTLRSDVSYRQGQVVKAEAEARVGWEAAIGERIDTASEPGVLMITGAMLVNALVARGQLDEAQRCLDRLPAPLPVRAEVLLPARAELRLAQDRVDEAIADLRTVGALLGDEFHKPVQNWRARLAVVLAGAGAREEARELAATELEQARRWEVPLAIGVALTAAGVVEGGAAGVTLLEQAVATLAATEGRLDTALALSALGAPRRRAGPRAAARPPLRSGMDLAARCGATAHADRAHVELVAAGARPRRDRRFLTGPESLTAGELRVAALAAEGLTDRQIAQRLYVTQAAVQFHLRNTFRKLGIRSRGDLAAALDSPVDEAKP
jgi:DNA-binding CsgD family transcriptional regulator/tetratricopeptide (TPR) repeat protein